jgi:hypothetical protein
MCMRACRVSSICLRLVCAIVAFFTQVHSRSSWSNAGSACRNVYTVEIQHFLKRLKPPVTFTVLVYTSPARQSSIAGTGTSLRSSQLQGVERCQLRVVLYTTLRCGNLETGNVSYRFQFPFPPGCAVYIFSGAEIGNGHDIIESRIYRHISLPPFL